MKKDPRRGCYVLVPAPLVWKAPDHARERLAALLLSTFAKTNGLHILLAQIALAVSRRRQPEIMHCVVGGGADGKSMVLVDLMQAVFGTGFANPACSLLQAWAPFSCSLEGFEENSRRTWALFPRPRFFEFYTVFLFTKTTSLC